MSFEAELTQTFLLVQCALACATLASFCLGCILLDDKEERLRAILMGVCLIPVTLSTCIGFGATAITFSIFITLFLSTIRIRAYWDTLQRRE